MGELEVKKSEEGEEAENGEKEKAENGEKADFFDGTNGCALSASLHMNKLAKH